MASAADKLTCISCLDECEEDKSIRCVLQCDQIVCVDCFPTVLELALQTRSYPICSCGMHYDYFKTVKRLDKLQSLRFNTVVDTFFSAMVGPKDAEFAAREIQLNRMKEEFIRSVPTAVRRHLGPNSALSKHFNKLTQQRLKCTTGVPCARANCNGLLLDETSPCQTCHYMLCQTCHIAYSSENVHVCKQEDVATREAVKDIVGCPKCKRKVFKYDGCIFMTCPYCQVNFDYKTGDPTNQGSHQRLQLVERGTEVVSNMLNNSLARDLLAKHEGVHLREPALIKTRVHNAHTRAFACKHMIFRSIRQLYAQILKPAQTKEEELEAVISFVEKYKLILTTVKPRKSN